jgi:hypothetical protein
LACPYRTSPEAGGQRGREGEHSVL